MLPQGIERALAPILVLLMAATGCVAVPALEERKKIPAQVRFLEERCPETRTPNGVMIQSAERQQVPLELYEGDSFFCAGVEVNRDAVEAFSEGRTPSSPNAAAWVGAYAIDTLIVLIGIPIAGLLMAVAVGGNSDSGSTGFTGGGTTPDGGAWSCAGGSCSGAGPNGAWSGNY